MFYDRRSRTLATLRETFWLLVLAIIVLFAFFLGLGTFSVRDVGWLTVGVVILVPVVILVARRTNSTLMRVGIPALAGLSVLHGLVPPHPGPQTAIALLKADQTQTLVFGLLIAIPTLIISGPLLGRLMDRWVPVYAPASLGLPAIDARSHERELQTASLGGGGTSDVGPLERGSRPIGVGPVAAPARSVNPNNVPPIGAPFARKYASKAGKCCSHQLPGHTNTTCVAPIAASR